MKKKEQGVLIYLQFPRGSLDNERKLDAVFDLQEILQEVIEKCKVGILDGNELFEDTVTFFLYGKDAKELYETVSPILAFVPYLKGSYVIQRFGEEREEQILL